PMQQVYRVVPDENQFFSYILKDLEIPHNRIAFYLNLLRIGKYLLVIKSTESQLLQAKSVFNYVGIKDWEVYYTPEAYHQTSSNFDKVSLYQNMVDNFMLSSLN
ncbi:MAG: hypothetical protein AAF757_30820, partial [Cyanobacteria bacterium P01_D01_bin.116]